LANEFSITQVYNVTKGSLTQSYQKQFQADFNGTHYSAGVTTIPTTAAGTLIPINTTDVASGGVSKFTNTDGTNYADIGVQVSGTFYPLVRLKPGEVWVTRLAITAPYARAHTASVALEWEVFED